jgi:hypothetical protein
MKKTLWTFALLILAASCVDRVNFDPPLPGAFAVVIDGFITDQPGPYEVKISKAFDIQSKASIKQMVNVNSVVLSDDQGNTETLVRVDDGVYRTQAGGMQGVVGRSYSLKVHLLDGRVYESDPDMLYPSGSVDSIYHEFISWVDDQGAASYGFDLFSNSSAGTLDNAQFLWRMVGTYQVDTNPEAHKVSCGEAKCPDPLPCSSYRLNNGQLEYYQPCACCTCWVTFYNDVPLVSDDLLSLNGKFKKVRMGNIPVTQWTFLYKVHVEVEQYSLSPKAFNFWRAIKAQKLAIGSLFQPLTGKIDGNFRQLSGPEGPVEGLFYASSVVKRSIFIKRSDIPSEGLIPVQTLPYEDSCLGFSNSTNLQPDFWQ